MQVSPILSNRPAGRDRPILASRLGYLAIVRRRQEIGDRFFRNSHWSSRHLRPLLNREILSVEGRHLRNASGFAQSSRPNLTQSRAPLRSVIL